MENITNKKEEMKQKKGTENDYIFTLKEPIQFEGDTITEIDLSKLKDATGSDLSNARRMMNMNGASLDVYPERTFEFAACLAAAVTNKPLDLFYNLKLKDSMSFKNMVRDFLY